MAKDENRSKVTFRSMGEPSWLILQVLEPDDAIPAVEITRRAERLLTAADYPQTHLDPSTLHYALRRMEDDGMVNCEGQRQVDVPGPRGGTRREFRPVYSITEDGLEMLRRKRKLDTFFRPVPWPRKGDQVFKSDGDWRFNAGINMLPDRWDMYAEGYKRAADHLVKDIVATGGRSASRDLDFLVYPIVFLYRQYLELCLKQLLRDTRLLHDSDRSKQKDFTHKINDMWEEYRWLSNTECPQEVVGVLDGIGDQIAQFSELDPESFAFRYPTNKKGNPSLSDGRLSSINLPNLSQRMETLATALGGLLVGTDERLQSKHELKAEVAWGYGREIDG